MPGVRDIRLIRAEIELLEEYHAEMGLSQATAYSRISILYNDWLSIYYSIEVHVRKLHATMAAAMPLESVYEEYVRVFSRLDWNSHLFPNLLLQRAEICASVADREGASAFMELALLVLKAFYDRPRCSVGFQTKIERLSEKYKLPDTLHQCRSEEGASYRKSKSVVEAIARQEDWNSSALVALLLRRAENLAEDQKNARAIAYFEVVRAKAVQKAFVLDYLGILYSRLRMWELAEKRYREAYRLEPLPERRERLEGFLRARMVEQVNV